MRSTRVLVRRMSIAADSDIEVPDDYVDVIVALADAVDILDRVWACLLYTSRCV